MVAIDCEKMTHILVSILILPGCRRMRELCQGLFHSLQLSLSDELMLQRTL